MFSRIPLNFVSLDASRFWAFHCHGESKTALMRGFLHRLLANLLAHISCDKNLSIMLQFFAIWTFEDEHTVLDWHTSTRCNLYQRPLRHLSIDLCIHFYEQVHRRDARPRFWLSNGWSLSNEVGCYHSAVHYTKCLIWSSFFYSPVDFEAVPTTFPPTQTRASNTSPLTWLVQLFNFQELVHKLSQGRKALPGSCIAG